MEWLFEHPDPQPEGADGGAEGDAALARRLQEERLGREDETGNARAFFEKNKGAYYNLREEVGPTTHTRQANTALLI